MKRSAWILLLVVTVLAAGLAIWSINERGARLAERTWGAPLFPGLEGRVNDIAELRLDTGHAAWTLKRDDTGWTLAERGGYPADLNRVKQAVVALAAARIVAPRTADPANHHRLDLEPPAQGLATEDDVRTIDLAALDTDGKPLAEMLVGKIKALPTARDPGQVYVRRKGEEQTWLVEGRFDIRKDPTAWLDKNLLKIGRAEVNAVTVRHPDGETLRLVRNRFGTLNVADLPEKLAERDTKLTAAQRSFEFVPFADVKPLADVDMSGATVATYHVDDGTKVTVRSVPAGFQVDRDPGYWITFDIEHDPTMAVTEEDLPIPGPNDAGKKREVDVEAGARRAVDAQARATGWAYLFAEFTAINYRHTLETVTSVKEGS